MRQSLLSEIGRFNAGTFRSSRLPLLNLPSDVPGTLRKGELEYTKAMAIARVKDSQLRCDLLSLAIAENLSLNSIKAHIKELLPQPESTPERILLERLSEINKRLHKSKTWGEKKKRERIARLLDELDKLTKES
jgi:ParB family chromosome partitioning protein